VGGRGMSYFDFLMELECIAAEKGLRLFMQRASIGCGFFLYFKNDNNQTHSPSITFMNGREDPEELFVRLRKLADEFNESAKLIAHTKQT
jgi:hypothetical protein